MIHVCFCITDKTGRYSKFVGTTMLSIFENTASEVTVHILHDNTLPADNRDKFIYIADRYGQRVKFYNVEESCVNEIEEIKKIFPGVTESRVSIATFYRFFIMTVLPENIEKAIYLDADIIVNLDINELWQIDLKDKILAVVPEVIQGSNSAKQTLCIDGFVKIEDYFNAGVLLMNIKILREEKETIINGMKFIANSRHAYLKDQNVLNYCFSSRTIKLPIKFNRMTYLHRDLETSIDKKIYHYATSGGLGFKQTDILNRLWMEYFICTPFFDVETMGRIYDEFMKIRDGLLRKIRNISAMMSGKKRGFFIEAGKINWLKNVFSVHDDEIVILGENEESLQKLSDIMKMLKGNYVFFILTAKFPKENFPFDKLIAEGFVEGVDFVKGWQFLEEGRVAFNSVPIIKAL